ncbi:B mating type pheromone [Trametes versicolor FP-101664 SS1]|uniref:B mating type pheromone n=1 Tax=Trametes versicolor (strain FP-101664) TaxID=717944 RepID=UPI0004622273|nr:B mating type pheromone [Trametes versicolor FP-101664 SS1]EIW57110.1 B mating type pheromone [Trametes versicolor FP-101664 SS1]
MDDLSIIIASPADTIDFSSDPDSLSLLDPLSANLSSNDRAAMLAQMSSFTPVNEDRPASATPTAGYCVIA